MPYSSIFFAGWICLCIAFIITISMAATYSFGIIPKCEKCFDIMWRVFLTIGIICIAFGLYGMCNGLDKYVDLSKMN